MASRACALPPRPVAPHGHRSRVCNPHGVTLLELVVAAGIVAILAGLALITYPTYVQRAKTVEAEVSLREIDRLERLYFQDHGRYASDLAELGFPFVLKHYVIGISLTQAEEQVVFKVVAQPKVSDDAEVAVLTHYRDGSTTLERVPSGGGNSSTGDTTTPGNSETPGSGRQSTGGRSQPPQPVLTPVDPSVTRGGKASG